MVIVQGVLERMKGCVVIPTFNESKIIYDLVIKIKEQGLDVLIVDDGSGDGTGNFAKKAGAKVIFHSRNMGKGMALRTGFQYVVNESYDFIITMDGDGQHRPEDIKNFIQYFSDYNSDIIVGNRMDEPKNMPFHRWIINKIMSMIISSICKKYIPDTQNGFRLIRASALRDMIFSTSNYEIDSELLIQASKKLYKIASVPIETIYSGQDSQIHPVVDTVRFFRFIFKDQVKEAWFVLKEFFNDAVIKHGSIIFLASLLCNFFSLVFWLFMVRKLHHVDYGILNSMVSFFSLASLPITILQTVLARYFSEFKAMDKKENTQALFRAFLKRITIINAIIVILFVVFSKNIANFLQLDNHVFVFLTAFTIFFASLLVLTISTLQGLQLFPRIALNSIVQGFTKILFGVTFVLMGFKALGAFLGFIVSGFLAFIFSLFQLPPWVLKMKRNEYNDYKPLIKLKDIYSYFLPVSIGLAAYSIFTNSDVILVKHFFSESEAGIYSIAQTVGKIILFLPGAITIVLFPIAVQHKALKKKTKPLLKRSLLFVSSFCVIAFIFTFLFPRFVLRVVSGQVLPECVLLVRLIIFPMSMFSFSYIFIFYNLSLRNIRFVVSIFVISLIQILLIYMFHSSLLDIIGILTISSLLTFYLGIRSISKAE